MKVFELLVANWDNLVAIVVIIIGIVYAIKTGEKKLITSFLFSLVTEAEKQFGTKTGVLKKAAVIQWIYERLPSFVKLLFSEKNLSDLIESALESAKLKWESNPALGEYIAGEAETVD